MPTAPGLLSAIQKIRLRPLMATGVLIHAVDQRFGDGTFLRTYRSIVCNVPVPPTGTVEFLASTYAAFTPFLPF